MGLTLKSFSKGKLTDLAFTDAFPFLFWSFEKRVKETINEFTVFSKLIYIWMCSFVPGNYVQWFDKMSFHWTLIVDNLVVGQ